MQSNSTLYVRFLSYKCVSKTATANPDETRSISRFLIRSLHLLSSLSSPVWDPTEVAKGGPVVRDWRLENFQPVSMSWWWSKWLVTVRESNTLPAVEYRRRLRGISTHLVTLMTAFCYSLYETMYICTSRTIDCIHFTFQKTCSNTSTSFGASVHIPESDDNSETVRPEK